MIIWKSGLCGWKELSRFDHNHTFLLLTLKHEEKHPLPDHAARGWYKCVCDHSWVIQIAVACLGLAGNSLAIPVLMSSKLNSIFNKILVFLTVFDNIFISCSLVEAIRTNVIAGGMGDVYIYLYAHFIFQVKFEIRNDCITLN